MLTVGGKKVIRSVPVEFSPDQSEVIRVGGEGARRVSATTSPTTTVAANAGTKLRLVSARIRSGA